MRVEPGFRNRGRDAQQFEATRSRVSCPGGVGFETSSARGGHGAGLVAKLTRPVLHEVSVRVIGTQLGLQTASRMTITGTRTGDFLPEKA
jgi:hypothetical protein